MRNDVKKVLSAEWFKLRRQRMFVVTPILFAATAFMMTFVLEFAARRDWIGVPSGYYISASVFSWMINLLVLFLIVMTSFLISQEFAIGTVKLTWTRPVSRARWYLSKVIFSAGAVVDLFLLSLLVIVVTALVRLDFTDLYENKYLIHASGTMATRFVLCAALTLVSLCATTSFVALIATLFRHPGGAMATAFSLGILLMVLGAFEPVRPFLLNTYLSLPAEQMVAMSKGIPLPMAWGDLVGWSLAVPAVWGVLSFVIGQRIIINKEISS